MNLSQLNHLIALYELGSFSRAAERLHLTQPALSRSVQALEAELGVALIDRVGKRNEFTQFGKTVVARARRVAHEADELKRSAVLLREGAMGSVRIGLSSGPAALLMVPLLKFMANAYPAVHLSLVQGPIAMQVAALHDKALDALVVDSRALVPAVDLQVEQLPDVHAGFLCRSGHPLCSLERITLAQLVKFPVASSPLSDEVARALVERYGPGGHPDSLVTLRCEHLASLLEVTLQTDAVYLGTLASARAALDAGLLVNLPMAMPLLSSARYALVSLLGRTEPPALNIVRRFVVDQIVDCSTYQPPLSG